MGLTRSIGVSARYLLVSARRAGLSPKLLFIIIGEAASHLPEDFMAIHPDLPWREMRDMRNIAVHEYFAVDSEIVWETLKKNLPPLLPLLRQMIKPSVK